MARTLWKDIAPELAQVCVLGVCLCVLIRDGFVGWGLLGIPGSFLALMGMRWVLGIPVFESRPRSERRLSSPHSIRIYAWIYNLAPSLLLGAFVIPAIALNSAIVGLVLGFYAFLLACCLVRTGIDIRRDLARWRQRTASE